VLIIKGEIISVGTEILLGDIHNTNAQYLSQECASNGLNIYYHTAVGDNPKRLAAVFNTALKRSDIIIITGGLGPTKDDLTKEIISKVLKSPLKLNWVWYKYIQELFATRAIIMPRNNVKQALIPFCGQILHNGNGTACGIYILKHEKHIFLLPGPPKEMVPMFNLQVIPKLLQLNLNKITSKVIKTYGIGESTLVELIDDLISVQSDPTIATLAKNDGIHIRITSALNYHEITKIQSILERRVKKYIWGYDEQTLNMLIIKKLTENNLSISMVESCTGGAISSMLTDIPGSSSVFIQGSVLYTTHAKAMFLKCPLNEIPNEGIDGELTNSLALKAKELSSTDIGFAITGALGPTSPEGVEIGTTYMSIAIKDKIISKKNIYYGSRESIKQKTVIAALHLIHDILNKEFNNEKA